MNYDFGKLDENRMMRYAPDSVRVIEHHTAQHEEYESYDEEGNPVGDSHMVTDEWTTERVVLHPTAEDYHAAGYCDIVDEPPTVEEGFHAEVVDWAEDKDAKTLTRVYEVVKDEPVPPPPKRYNKNALADAIVEAGKFAELNALFEKNPVLLFRWNSALEFVEDDKNFVQFRSVIVSEFGEETVAAILEKAEA